MPDTTQHSMTLDEARKRFPPMWVVYDHPADYPDHFVVRLWYGLTREEAATPCGNLVEAREYIATQGGCVPFGRYDEDDPVILEFWL